jgi:hypothetical protein
VLNTSLFEYRQILLDPNLHPKNAIRFSPAEVLPDKSASTSTFIRVLSPYGALLDNYSHPLGTQ